MKQLFRSAVIGSAVICTIGGSRAQWTQTVTAAHITAGLGVGHVNVGTTAPFGLATLRVRGDQLSVLDADPLQAGMRCTFRSDVASGIPQSWRMYRDVNRIGAIWNESNHRVWHVQSLEQRDVGQDRYSGLMLQNEAGDGMWVMNAGAPTGTRAFPVPATQQALACRECP